MERDGANWDTEKSAGALSEQKDLCTGGGEK